MPESYLVTPYYHTETNPPGRRFKLYEVLSPAKPHGQHPWALLRRLLEFRSSEKELGGRLGYHAQENILIARSGPVLDDVYGATVLKT